MTLRECGEYVKEIFGLGDSKDLWKSGGSGEPCGSLAGIRQEHGGIIRKGGRGCSDHGDFGHHDGIDAVMQGVSVIDAGHYGLEHIFIGQMSEFIRAEFPQLQVYCEETENPLK